MNAVILALFAACAGLLGFLFGFHWSASRAGFPAHSRRVNRTRRPAPLSTPTFKERA